mmetsp:Transcript_67169/g.194222  ORF Transcript_67169/g.194222 Transcript_67169/m.194222 type:complete len:266 (+) Transcript_67169:1847-2644(+)
MPLHLRLDHSLQADELVLQVVALLLGLYLLRPLGAQGLGDRIPSEGGTFDVRELRLELRLLLRFRDGLLASPIQGDLHRRQLRARLLHDGCDDILNDLLLVGLQHLGHNVRQDLRAYPAGHAAAGAASDVAATTHAGVVLRLLEGRSLRVLDGELNLVEDHGGVARARDCEGRPRGRRSGTRLAAPRPRARDRLDIARVVKLWLGVLAGATGSGAADVAAALHVVMDATALINLLSGLGTRRADTAGGLLQGTPGARQQDTDVIF